MRPSSRRPSPSLLDGCAIVPYPLGPPVHLDPVRTLIDPFNLYNSVHAFPGATKPPGPQLVGQFLREGPTPPAPFGRGVTKPEAGSLGTPRPKGAGGVGPSRT